MPQLLDKMPTPIVNFVRTRFGKHLSRFAGVALLSLATTQVTLSIAYLIIGTGGWATLFGWFAGALVSYVLSRKAWDRKGRPHLLKETLPFWAISAGTAIALITAGHVAGEFAKDHHLSTLAATATVDLTVLMANVLTFITRFLILHFVLFADRGQKVDATAGLNAESLYPVGAADEPGRR